MSKKYLYAIPIDMRATGQSHAREPDIRNHTMTEDLNTTEMAEVTASPVLPMILTATEAAAMLSVKERTWRTWHASGRIPQPIRIGRKVFWQPEDLKAWVVAGCPDRKTWEVMRT